MRGLHLQVKGRKLGPLPEDKIWQIVAEGEIPSDALAWHEGLPDWVPVKDLIGTATGASLVRIENLAKSFGEKSAL